MKLFDVAYLCVCNSVCSFASAHLALATPKPAVARSHVGVPLPHSRQAPHKHSMGNSNPCDPIYWGMTIGRSASKPDVKPFV